LFGRRLALLGAVAVLVAACGGGTPAASVSPAVTATAAGTSASGDIVFPKPEKSSVKIAVSGLATIGGLPEHFMVGTGINKKYGVDVEYIEFGSAANAAQALIAGQTDLQVGSGGPVVASLATGSPQQLVFVTRHNLTDNLYTQKNITSAADLKGKSIAISSFGSQSHAGALLSLRALGLTDKDVTLTTVGNDVARIAALKAGSVAGSMQDYAIQADLTAQGFNVLVRLSDVKVPGGVPVLSIIVPVDFGKKYPNTTLALVASYLEAITVMRQQPAKAAEIMAPILNITVEAARKQVDTELANTWEPRDGRCDSAVMEFVKQVNLPSNPGLAAVDPQKGCTNEFLDKLKTMGFQKKLGIPGY
jgi:NitT/TauT family transport system substrate-binding protein